LLPEDRQELRPKYVGVMFNDNIVQQVFIKYCVCTIVAWKMYSIQFVLSVLVD